MLVSGHPSIRKRGVLFSLFGIQEKWWSCMYVAFTIVDHFSCCHKLWCREQHSCTVTTHLIYPFLVCQTGVKLPPFFRYIGVPEMAIQWTINIYLSLLQCCRMLLSSFIYMWAATRQDICVYRWLGTHRMTLQVSCGCRMCTPELNKSRCINIIIKRWHYSYRGCRSSPRSYYSKA